MVGFKPDSLKSILNYRMSESDSGKEHPLPAFLNGLSASNVIEDRQIEHDMSALFTDWTPIAKYQVGAQTFRQGNKRLTVMNVNRAKLERTAGVDLLFFHENHQSYIFVQFKRMVEENYGSTFRYRPNDSYVSELKRMQEIRQRFTHSKST